MENKNNQFTEWLFNRFVETERMYGKSRSHDYLMIFSHYLKWGFNYPNPKLAEQYARITFSTLEFAVYNWKTHLLDLKGNNAQKDHSKRMKAYRKRLKALGYSQDEIANLLIDKYRLNNPKKVISPYEPL